MSFGWLVFASFTLTLELLVFFFLLTGPWKRLFFVLIVCAIQILVTCSDAVFLVGLKWNGKVVGVHSPAYFNTYWTGDLLGHVATSALIISLIYQALKLDARRRNTSLLIAAAVVAFAAYSLYTFHAPHLNRWMTPVSRNLSFCEELLNLVLWSILLQRRASDYLLLMVSAGIGVQVTGEVIGHTLRMYTHSLLWAPDTLVSVCGILCLLIWIFAFRAARRRPALHRAQAAL